MTPAQQDRFFAHIEPHQACWRWTGARLAHGYGRISVGGWKLAHRVAYEFFIGQIPAGMDLDHLCRTRDCVNPTHLEPVTARENSRRGKRCKASAVWDGTTAEHRAKISRALMGIVRSDETKARLRAAWERRKAAA